MGKLLPSQNIQHQKMIARAVLKAEESQRNKIGLELHDNVNQILACAKMFLDIGIQDSEPRKMNILLQAKNFINNAVSEIRSLSKGQVSPMKEVNLKQLVKTLLSQLNQTTSISTKFIYKVNRFLIDDDLKLNVYRIAQEQINNITKYADASVVSITIHTIGRTLYVVIKDNGKGFDVNKKRKGIGVSNMINRVQSFNGEYKIQSSMGHGCIVMIKIPLVKKERFPE